MSIIPDSSRLAFLKASNPYALKGSLLLLSGMALAGPVLCLSVTAAPLVLLFSPVLVVAFLAAAAVFTGLTIFAGLGVSAYWLYNNTAGKKTLGAERLCFCLIGRVRKAIKVLLLATPPRKEVAASNVVT